MTLYWISCGLMTVAAVVLYIINRRLIKALRNSNDCLKSANFLIGKFGADKNDYDLSIMHKAEVEERTELIPHFAVYRKGLTEKHDIIRVGYDPTDPDDRDYKRIHAEEVAEMLNEKP